MERITRSSAVFVLYKIINSGIINEDLENELLEIANCIENDEWGEEEPRKLCLYADSKKENESGEKLFHCELTDSWKNVTLGECINNCENQERY